MRRNQYVRQSVWVIALVLLLGALEGASAQVGDREARAQRAAEIIANLRSYHQSAIKDLERPDYATECSDIVHISREVINWSVSDKGMRSGEETPWSDHAGLPEIELTPEVKNTLREIAGYMLADIDKRLGRGADACFPPPASETAESTGREGTQGETTGFILPGIVRRFLGEPDPSAPGDGSSADLEERVAELESEASRRNAIRSAELGPPPLPPLIIVVTNPDGSLYIPGTGTCFRQPAQNGDAKAGDFPQTNCPRGMPADHEMRHGIRQQFGEASKPEQLRDQYGQLMFDSAGRPILYPSWSDFQVTPEYAESLQSASDPLYLPYKWSNALPGTSSSGDPIIWTQEDIGKVTRHWMLSAPEGQKRRVSSLDQGLTPGDIEALKNLQIEQLPAGSPSTGKGTKPKATTGTGGGATPRKTTSKSDANKEIGQQILRGVIQYGIGTLGNDRRDRRDDRHHKP
jgi:hypothetical protein